MSAGRLWGERRQPQLAPDELLVWQGAPAWRGVARRVYHLRLVALYFGGLTLLDMAITRLHGGGGWPVVHAAKPTVLTGGACLLILAVLAWATERTTRYTVTNRRVIMQFGVALPAMLSIPLSRIEAVRARVRPDHSGDVALRLKPGATVMYAKLWPHARSWRYFRPEPMLRDLPGAAAVAPLLCRAVAAAAEARALPVEADLAAAAAGAEAGALPVGTDLGAVPVADLHLAS